MCKFWANTETDLVSVAEGEREQALWKLFLFDGSVELCPGSLLGITLTIVSRRSIIQLISWISRKPTDLPLELGDEDALTSVFIDIQSVGGLCVGIADQPGQQEGQDDHLLSAVYCSAVQELEGTRGPGRERGGQATSR